MKANYPLISCICVTNNRTKFLRRAIRCFNVQNYPNKELIISFPRKDENTRTFLKEETVEYEANIIQIEREDRESVGNARNQAISKCRGDYICVWDDDDWYHASRLSFQYNSMQTTGIGYHASVLTRLLMFDYVTKKAYLSFYHSWENTLLCRKEIIFQNQYAHQNKGEDTHIIKFLDGKKFLHHIEDAPFLYIYVYHGENTWDYEHYKYLINKSEILEDNLSNEIQKLIEGQ